MFLVSRRLNHCSATNQKVTFWPKETGIRYGDAISGKAIFTSGRLFCLLLFSARELVWWPHGGFLFHLLYYYIERSWTFGRRGQCFQLLIHFENIFREIKTNDKVTKLIWRIFTRNEKNVCNYFYASWKHCIEDFFLLLQYPPHILFLAFRRNLSSYEWINYIANIVTCKGWGQCSFCLRSRCIDPLHTKYNSK